MRSASCGVMVRDCPRSCRGLRRQGFEAAVAIAERPIQQRIHRNRSAFGMRNLVVAGGDLLGAAREFAAGQRFQHQRRDQPVTEQGDFFGFGIHEEDLLSQKHKAEGHRRLHAKAVWGHSGGRRRRAERGTTPVRSEKRRPAQQVESQIGEQEAVSGDPADGLQHVQSAVDEVRSRRWRSQRRQRRANSLGLPLKAANPELAALVRHGRLARRPRQPLPEWRPGAGGRPETARSPRC